MFPPIQLFSERILIRQENVDDFCFDCRSFFFFSRWSKQQFVYFLAVYICWTYLFFGGGGTFVCVFQLDLLSPIQFRDEV
jgi:hypothetical protein